MLIIQTLITQQDNKENRFEQSQIIRSAFDGLQEDRYHNSTDQAQKTNNKPQRRKDSKKLTFSSSSININLKKTVWYEYTF